MKSDALMASTVCERLALLINNAPLLDVLLRVLRERAARLHERVRAFGREYGAVRIHRDSLARHALTVPFLALERRDVRGHAILRPRTDAHTVAPVRVVQRT